MLDGTAHFSEPPVVTTMPSFSPHSGSVFRLFLELVDI